MNELPSINNVISMSLQCGLVRCRINFTRIFKVFQIAFGASRFGQFCENFKNTHEMNAQIAPPSSDEQLNYNCRSKGMLIGVRLAISFFDKDKKNPEIMT